MKIIHFYLDNEIRLDAKQKCVNCFLLFYNKLVGFIQQYNFISLYYKVRS